MTGITGRGRPRDCNEPPRRRRVFELWPGAASEATRGSAQMHLTCACGVSQSIRPSPKALRNAAALEATPEHRLRRALKEIPRDRDTQRAQAAAGALARDLGDEARDRLVAALGNVLTGMAKGDAVTATLVLGDLAAQPRSSP